MTAATRRQTSRPGSARPRDSRRTPGPFPGGDRELLLAAIQAVPELPRDTSRLLDLAGQAGSSVADLAVAVEGDPRLAGGLLRVVNSPLYGFAHRIRNVQHAIALIGTRNLRRLALWTPVRDVVRAGRRPGGIDRGVLWRHSVAVATAAASLARSTGLGDPDEAYSAGLLHDVGKALLDSALGPVRPAFAGPGAPIASGPGHGEAGAHLVRRWRLGDRIAVAVQRHHAADLRALADPDARNLAALVAVADSTAWQLGHPSIAGGHRPTLSPHAVRIVDVYSIDRNGIAEEIQVEFDRVATLLSSGTVPAMPRRRESRS